MYIQQQINKIKINCFAEEVPIVGDGYLNLITERIISELRQIYQNRFNRLWWIQDGALAHRSRAVRESLQNIFTDRIIALNHTIEWPADNRT